VARSWLLLLTSGLCTLGCGPDRSECTTPHADFSVELRLRDRPLPADTVVHVTYGGSGMEDYSLMMPRATHEVVFCHPSNSNCMADGDAGSALGAAGAPADDGGVQEICCDLWTGGFAKLEIRASGLTTMTYELAPREHVCTVTKTFVIDSPDGG
jgi:hypothetical protein